MKTLPSLAAALGLLLLASPGTAGGEFKLADGDRVVFLGSTLVEREQRSGWWELALTVRHPGRKITFRNLGWSGDTVFGESHVGFAYTQSGSADVARGFQHLKAHTLALKPTVLILGYGTNESFEGEKGLPAFVKGLNALLDALAPAKAKVVLLSPLRQGTMPAPLPDPAKNNKHLRLYADAVREVARKRGATFVDLYDLLGDPGKVEGVTEDGIQLTQKGYRWSVKALEKGLGLPAPAWGLELDVKAKKVKARGAKAEWLRGEGLRVRVADERLLPFDRRVVVLKGLPGVATLTHDGLSDNAHTPAEWQRGVPLRRDPTAAAVEKLRQAIVAKNELYFHRWRPQNETYLFGFRKREQGKNAIEIPKFDPLVAAKEKEIVELSRPVAYTLEVGIGGGGR